MTKLPSPETTPSRNIIASSFWNVILEVVDNRNNVPMDNPAIDAVIHEGILLIVIMSVRIDVVLSTVS